MAIALDGLANIVTQDLARDVSKDLYGMLNHSRPSIRKRSVLVLYKLFLKFPEIMEQNFARLREKLGDNDPGQLNLDIIVNIHLT